MYINPIFSINVYFTVGQVSFWIRDDSLWQLRYAPLLRGSVTAHASLANLKSVTGRPSLTRPNRAATALPRKAEIKTQIPNTLRCGPMALKFDYIFQGPFAAISCSWNLPFPCTRSLCSTVACRRIPSSLFKTSMLWTGSAEPGPRYRRHPKTIILGHGNGDSRQISPIKNVNSLLRAAPSIFWEDPPKCLLGYEFYHSIMFGVWWAFTAANNFSRTNKPTLRE